ncbi:MAG: hypothetical protein IKH34_00655 [Oscillospiraceae bacterium]|nr:hypothetical protein [Oscillospiraceae bacterium]
MEKFIPYEKLSKKQKRKLDAARRNTWGGLSPVTRRPENPKAYKRKKRIEEKDLDPLFSPGFESASHQPRPVCFFLESLVPLW